MSRYQKHLGIATFRAVGPGSIFLIFAVLTGLFSPRHAHAAPWAQNDDGNLFPAYYVTPLGSTRVELHTLTVDFTVTDSADGGLAVAMAAGYRLTNSSVEPVTVEVRIATLDAAGQGALTVTANGSALPLDPLADGSFSTVLTVPADGRVDVQLRSSAGMDQMRLPLLHYNVRALFGWPGRSSLRVSVTVPDAVAPESWIRVAPDGWSFSAAPSAQQTTIKWLYEADWPTTPFVFQFVHPDVWQEARRADVAAGPGMPVDTFLTLGNLYASLYAEALADLDTLGQAGERFYAQALAAYAAGVAEGEARTLPPADLAPLHAGMAALYRSRVTDAAGAVDHVYAELMVRAAGAALAGFPPDTPRARELQQWRADGLRQMVAEARRRSDWASVAALLQEMTNLPPELVVPEVLAEERRMATVQQALQLLQQGNREAATALAGPELVTAALAPQTSLPLAAGWQVTVTIEPEMMVTEFRADVLPEGVERAQRTFGDQLARWQSAALPEGARFQMQEEPGDDGIRRWRITLMLPNREAALALAQSLPANADWALMRTVLQQLDPQRTDRSGLLRRSMRVSQQYELRAVSEQWREQAQLLDQQAAEFEAQAALSAAGDVAAVEAALQASVRAANYRNAANLWQNLLESAAVVTRMELPDGFGVAERTWLTTLTTPAQPLSFQVNGPNPAGLLLVLAGGIVLLFLISGLLWRLL